MHFLSMHRSLMLYTLYLSSWSVVSHAFSVLCVYLKFGHHPQTLGYLCAKFHFFHGLHCCASPWRKIVYSITHSPSLFDAPGTEYHNDTKLKHNIKNTIWTAEPGIIRNEQLTGVTSKLMRHTALLLVGINRSPKLSFTWLLMDG